MSIRLAIVVTSVALLLGPPGIKVDAVTNPETAPVKGAVFMITARHHQSPEGFTVAGRAEGIIAGKRVSRPITLIPAATKGLYGVTRQWDAGQPWVLIFSVIEAGHDSNGVAEASVRIASDGKVVGVDYPMTRLGTTPWPRRVAAREIDEALTALARTK